MVIAIPTYQRQEIIKKRTLAYLERCGVAKQDIHLVCSNKQEAASYRASVGEGYTIHCPEKEPITNVTGKFNFLHTLFPEGTEVVVFEDDIIELVSVGPKSTKEKPLSDLSFLKKGFDACRTAKTKLFGIIPHSNGFYMKYSITGDFKFCVAHCYGFISDHSRELLVTQIGKSDYERTVLYYLKFGSVVRFNYIGVKTTSYTLDGGMEHSGRSLHEEQSCQYLVRRYPNFFRFNDKKQSQYRELSLRRVSENISILRALQEDSDKRLGYA